MKFQRICDQLCPADSEAIALYAGMSNGDTITVEVKGGKRRRSIEQNALYQLWARDYAKHLLGREKITEAEHEAMKMTLQRHCYIENGWSFLIEVLPDMFGGKAKPSRRSTTDFDKGEMHQFMNWVQYKAADDGLILESLGEYAELKQGQAA